MFNRLARFLQPGQDVFFTLLVELAGRMKAAASVYGELARASYHEQLADIAGRLKAIETEADQVCGRVYEHLDRTFVTPIDQGDLRQLARALDDVVDALEEVAAFAALFQFDTLTEPMRELIRITAMAVTGVQEAIDRLSDSMSPNLIRELAEALHTLKSEADAVCRSALEGLYEGGSDARELVRQTDMLFYLAKGVDTCKNAVELIRSVVLKNG